MKQGLPPLLWPGARILVLGSLPGDESLRKQQYYGNPRNQFWAILGRLFDEDGSSDYAQRLAFLERNGVALWDVIERAERHGSLDSNIRNDVPNDFGDLFGRLPHLRTIALNGAKASASFLRHVQPKFAERLEGVRVLSLPSTSAVPARKFLDLAAKAEVWRTIIA
jgi:hypoxanthine-DNA glycosylase